MKTENKITIPALTEAWHSFPWDNHPGGVKVTFLLMPESGAGVALLRLKRDWYELPQCDVCKTDTLEQKLVEFNLRLKQLGVLYTRSTKISTVLGWVSKDGVLHVLLHVPYVEIGPVDRIEFVQPTRAYMIKSGLSLSNQVSPYLPALLGWEAIPVDEMELAAA